MRNSNRYIFVIFAMFIAGCSNPTTVHLYKKYLDDKTTQSIKSELENVGLNVEVNELKFPRDITTTSIVYSPLLLSPTAIEQTENVIENLGFEINNISSLVSSNHWYTKNTLGLFVVPEGTSTATSITMSDLAHTYKSADCPLATEIKLNADGTFSYQKDKVESLIGQWSITGYPYIMLQKPTIHLSYYFEIETSERIDKIGKIAITKLIPRSSAREIESCNMETGIRI